MGSSKKDIHIDWHDDYEREWCDADGPLTVINVSCIDWILPNEEEENCLFIGYTCNDNECRRCNDSSLVMKGHYKIIRKNGLDPFGRVEIKYTRKREIINIVDQMVFKRA